MTDFVCRTHDKAFVSLKALSDHIEKEHSSQGMIHCVYRDKSTGSKKGTSTKTVQQLKDFVGDGLKAIKPTRVTGPMSPAKEGFLTTLDLLYEAPRFIAEAVRGMKHRKMRRLFPDIHHRYSQVIAPLDFVQELKKSSRIKHAVFSILIPV